MAWHITEGQNKKLAEGNTHREALRSPKRQISDAAFTRLRTDARRAPAQVRDPGEQQGNVSAASAAGSHPRKPALRARRLPDLPLDLAGGARA